MTAKTNAEKQADFRARNKQADLAEVRGIIAPKPHHDEIKLAARKAAAKLAKRKPPKRDGEI